MLLKQLIVLILFAGSCLTSYTQTLKPDTVTTGIYVTSIHDIDFKEQEYTITFWLWFTYTHADFDFMQNLEVPLAKTVTRSFATLDTVEGKIHLLMKLQCVMKDSWKIDDFPFDRQILRLSVENSQYDSHSLVFVPDTSGKHFDPRFTLQGWAIDSFSTRSAIKPYETTFGEPGYSTPHTEYSSYRVRINIHRSAYGLFLKLFIGMYVAFLIAYVCFYIHADSIDSRFSLSVGSLFAVIGNKYIIDSSLPDSLTFTLVDTLHGITLLFILAIISSTVYSLHLIKKGKPERAKRFDTIIAQVLLILYILLNVYFVMSSNMSQA